MATYQIINEGTDQRIIMDGVSFGDLPSNRTDLMIMDPDCLKAIGEHLYEMRGKAAKFDLEEEFEKFVKDRTDWFSEDVMIFVDFARAVCAYLALKSERYQQTMILLDDVAYYLKNLTAHEGE